MAKQSFKVFRKRGKMSANFKWARDKNIHIYTYTKRKPLYGKVNPWLLSTGSTALLLLSSHEEAEDNAHGCLLGNIY